VSSHPWAFFGMPSVPSDTLAAAEAVAGLMIG
jgi:hypothetical protein